MPEYIAEASNHPSVCPLDCPDCCSLDVSVADNKVVAVHGSKANPYTDGVICNKVSRYYPEFVHGNGRLTKPLQRTGKKYHGMQRWIWCMKVLAKQSISMDRSR